MDLKDLPLRPRGSATRNDVGTNGNGAAIPPPLKIDPYLAKLWSRGCDFLGTYLAILGGAMTWVSERHLVAAISNAGGFGILACGAMTPEQLDGEIAATRALTDRPFGVNIVTMHPALAELIEVSIRHSVGHVVLAGGLPHKTTIARLKDAGIKVICFAPSLGLARKLVQNGADALIIEGAEAGGHIGPVTTSVLAQEILPVLDAVPVFVAGGIGRGEAILAYCEMGAAGCQLGTRFVCAHESIAHPDFKRAFIRADARDAVASLQLDARLPVIPVRALANQATKEFIALQRRLASAIEAETIPVRAAQLEIEHFWAGALRRAVIDGDVITGSLMAGQSVGMVTEEQSTAAILGELMAQATAAIAVRHQQSHPPRDIPVTTLSPWQVAVSQ